MSVKNAPIFRKTLNPRSSEEALAEANNQFTVDFYKKIVGDNSNVVVSPFSVSTTLSMLLVGARAATADQMKYSLAYTQLSRDQINDGYKQIIPALTGNYTLEITNAIFVKKDTEILKSYKDTLQSVYQSGVFHLDMDNGQEQINKFVNARTRGKILKMLDEKLPSDTEMLLLNAIYFKGSWKTKFKKKHSEKGTFTNDGGGKTKTILMHITDKFKYKVSDALKSQILMLPYTGERMYMMFVLPIDETQCLSATEDILTGKALVGAAKSAYDENVIVTIPKFKIESTFALNEPLIATGMNLAFSNSANFNGLSSETKLKVSRVLQKAKVEVNEKGTEAKAADTDTGIRQSAITGPQIHFTANRSFLYALYHKPTNSILFIGRYTRASP